jgi:predicted DNA-binding transcriptional regulator AlpA
MDPSATLRSIATCRPRRTPAPTVDVMNLPDALVKIDMVAAVNGKSASWVIREVAAGRLPPPAVRGHRATRWRVRDVMAHLRGEWKPSVAE